MWLSTSRHPPLFLAGCGYAYALFGTLNFAGIAEVAIELNKTEDGAFRVGPSRRSACLCLLGQGRHVSPLLLAAEQLSNPTAIPWCTLLRIAD
jgi:hypothetical protein